MEPLHSEEELMVIATRLNGLTDYLEKDILHRPCRVYLRIDLYQTYIKTANDEAMTLIVTDTNDENTVCIWMLNHDDQVGQLIVQAFKDWTLAPPTLMEYSEVCQFHLR